jgi:8-oxo-dGTP pyrophosphatase MutT (NUDIX family)
MISRSLAPSALAEALRERLASPDEGPTRRLRFATQLEYGRHRGPAPPGTRRATVVVLMYPRGDQWCIPFTLRAKTLSVHAGQISLPGGAREVGETVEQCGLRELEEEIGVPSIHLSVLGKLSPIYVYRSNFLVQPLVALAPQPLQFRPDHTEVEQLLEVPLSLWLDPSHYDQMWIARSSLRFLTPCFCSGSFRIWGATFKVVRELLDRAGDLLAS